MIYWPCEKISVNSTTVIKNDIASGLKNSRSIFLQYTINTVICQVSSTVSLFFFVMRAKLFLDLYSYHQALLEEKIYRNICQEKSRI